MKASVQLVRAGPVLVSVMPAWNPPGQLLASEYVTVHIDVAALADCVASVPPTSASALSASAQVTAETLRQIMTEPPADRATVQTLGTRRPRTDEPDTALHLAIWMKARALAYISSEREAG